MAVDKRIQGKGFGEILLAHAAKVVYESAQSVGVYAMFTEAKDEQAAAFYQKMGFTRQNTVDGRLIYFYPTHFIQPLIDYYPF